MSVVVVELIKADPSSMSAFVEHLVEAGIGQERTGSPQVQVNSFAESVMIGKVIAAFIEATPGSYELRADGPGAAIYRHRLHAPDDAVAIADILATCAGLK